MSCAGWISFLANLLPGVWIFSEVHTRVTYPSPRPKENPGAQQALPQEYKTTLWPSRIRHRYFLTAVFGNSFEPLRFYSCFKSISKDNNFREHTLNTSNSCCRIFISKNEINMRRKREIKTFPTTLVYKLFLTCTMFYLNKLIKQRKVYVWVREMQIYQYHVYSFRNINM